HALAASQMRGFGGVLSVELAGGYQAADNFIGRLAHFRRSASLGGVESLAVHPAAMGRGMLSEQDIAASGVPSSLVRLAAGTEDTEDLVADVLAAADTVTGSDRAGSDRAGSDRAGSDCRRPPHAPAPVRPG